MSGQKSLRVYDGHPIFHNQPPYTYFSNNFENPTDAFFLGLNEIDAQILQEEQMQDETNFQTLNIKDPRTQQDVLTFCYDHSDQRKPKLFFGGDTKSSLSKSEHVICIRVLQAWQEQKEVDEKDVLVWRNTEKRRLKEKQQMLKFIYDYSQSKKEDMYAPAKRLVTLYRNWYQKRVEKLLIAHAENVAYNAYTGLPHVRVCKNLLEQTVVIKNAELVARKGHVQFWQSDNFVDCRTIRNKLKTLAEIYNAEEVDSSRLLEEDIDSQLQTKPHNCSRIYVPLDTLLFLLTAGDYVDLPNEVLLDIELHVEEDIKIVRFEEPLPSRNCGWHTHKQVVEQAYAAYISMLDTTKWLNVENEYVTDDSVDEIEEIVAFGKQPRPFQPIRLEEYLQNCQSKCKPLSSRMKQNCALIKWQLQQDGVEDYLELYTTLALPPALNTEATEFLGSFSIKLEYKPQFGCEVMTKHELLRKWFHMSLLEHCAVTAPNGMCLRIAADTFETQLKEQLSLSRIEQQLLDIYQVSMPQLLTNLSTFFKLLLNVPAGNYMLRYSPKAQDKLLLCAPAKEITQNTIYLHSLLKTESTDMLFMTQLQFLPIVDHLCSVVHLYHKVLPCAFLPLLPHQKSTKRTNKPSLVITDEGFVRKKTQEERAKEAAYERRRRNIKKKRKRKQNTLRKAKKRQEELDKEELTKEIEMDKLFFGF